jgi:hypothetical protein
LEWPNLYYIILIIVVMSKIELCANYKRVGNKLFSKDHILLIRERNKVSTNKPKKFLLKLDTQSNKGDYISSLYSTTSTHFNFDFNGVKYQLKLDGDSLANISKSTL